jgi:hypothetical protein
VEPDRQRVIPTARGVEALFATNAVAAVRGPALVEADVVKLRGADADEYLFTASYDFLAAASSLDTADSVVRFVARYGLAFTAPELEDPDDWAKELKHIWLMEPIGEYLQLASDLRDVRRLYRLAQSVSRGDESFLPSLRKALAWFGMDDDDQAESRAEHYVTVPPDDLAHHALRIVALALNIAFERHDARFSTGVGPLNTISIIPVSVSLAGHTWLQVAIEALQKLDLRECEACGAVFAVTDPRKRYCNSRCSGRTRAKRFRQAHRFTAT